MPEILLNGPRVVPLVGEFVARRMPQHVRMDGEGEFRPLAGAGDELAHRRGRHGAAALGDEQVGRLGVIATQLAQRPQLGAADRVGGRQAVLQSGHMDQAGLEVDLVPAERHELGDPQPMPVRQEN